jgi:erythromycin esterase
MSRILAVLLALAACGQETKRTAQPAPVVAPPPPAVTTPSISGHVRDARGAAVSGAQVALLASVVEAHTVSDASGAYHFDVPRPGTWHVTAQARGHVAAFVEGVKVIAASNVDIALGASDGADITVTVKSDFPLPSDAALVISRESTSEGDAWFVPIDPATKMATVTLPRSRKYFVDAMGPVRGEIQVLDTARVASLDVRVPQPPDAEVGSYVREHAVAIGAIGVIVDDAKTVAVGEATHGTHEFFELKHRMFAYLAAEKGFTTLAFEADQAECRAIEAFVQGESPPGVTARMVVEGIQLAVWRTEEVVALVQWMREYNQTARTRVHFVGFDMQSYKPARVGLGRFLESVDPEAAAELAKATAGLDEPFPEDTWMGSVFAELPESTRIVVTNGFAKAASVVAAHRQKPGAEDAQRNVERLQQWSQYVVSTTDGVRDRMMADNLVALRKRLGVGVKMMIWAHNYHVGRYAELQSMGTHLAKAWGREYVAFGVLFGEGTVMARTLTDPGNEKAGYTGYLEHAIAAAPPWDAAAPFAGVTTTVALDLRALPASSKAAAWFTTPHPIRELGWLFYSERMLPRMGVLTARYDAAIYVPRSTSSRMLRR